MFNFISIVFDNKNIILVNRIDAEKLRINEITSKNEIIPLHIVNP
jgi:hypothetical protein